jgi:signal transduction histidine kinase
LLVLAAGGAAWLLAGRALRPVRLMTAQVDEITAVGPGAHVPEPPTRDEIARLARTMNAMLDRVASADAARRRFVSDASHELRSPLTVIRSEAELAAADPTSTDSAALAEAVLAEARRLERVVDDLLALARLDEGRATSDVTVVDLDDVVLEEAARRRRVPVDVRGVSAGRVRASAGGMRRVVQHLLDNAATHAATRATVALRREGDAVVLEVADDGPGIDPTHRERVFERFTRLDDARARDTGGAGLGLSVVAALVEEAGGKVTVAANGPEGHAGATGAGALFRVRLPAAD